MAPREFRGIIPPRQSKHEDGLDIITFFMKDSFTLPTLLLLGALLQKILVTILPPRVAFLPAGLLTLYNLFSTAIQAARSPHNAYMRSVLLGRTSAQLPSPDTATFGSRPAAHPLVVFHFGIRINHPLGILSPGAQATLAHFTACNDLVIAKSDEYGMLGLSPWRAAERGSNNTLMMVYYFRDVDGLNKFAHDDMHRKAWDCMARGEYKHIGFFHEAFCVPEGAYESIYGNFHPLLMGQMNVKCVDDEGKEVWVRPVVDADVGPLRSQFGRMGRAFEEYQS